MELCFANLYFFFMGLLNAKLTADKIIEVHITHRSWPLPLPRLSSRGDFLVKLRLSNLRPGWQCFKSTWADLELGCKNSVTRNRRQRGCSRTGLNRKCTADPAAELRRKLAVSTQVACARGTQEKRASRKTTPQPNTCLSTHTALLSFTVHAVFPNSSRGKCYFFRRLAFPIDCNCPNKSQVLAQLIWYFSLTIKCYHQVFSSKFDFEILSE